MMLTLSLRNVDRLDQGLPTMFVLDRRNARIGRSSTCDWTLPDPDNHISSRHCEIAYRDGAYVLKDISTNGTFLNGADDSLDGEHVIADGDVIRIGHYEVVATLTEIVEPAPAREAAPLPAAAETPAEADAAALISGRYRLDDIVRQGAVFEDFRATDMQLGRQVLVKLVKANAKVPDKALAAACFARWRDFARHHIPGMPAILALAADAGGDPGHLVIDLADASPLEALLATDMVRTFRPWLLDRILCDVLRTLTEIHARKLVHGAIDPGNVLVSSTTGAVFLTNPMPEGATDQPYTAGADVFALGKLLEDAAWQIGSTPRAVTGWMTAPDAHRPTAAEVLETIGLGMQAMKPVFAPSDPALPPADRVIWASDQPSAVAPPAAPGWSQADDGAGPTMLIPAPLPPRQPGDA